MLQLNTHPHYKCINTYYFSLEEHTLQSLLIQYLSTQCFGDLCMSKCVAMSHSFFFFFNF